MTEYSCTGPGSGTVPYCVAAGNQISDPSPLTGALAKGSFPNLRRLSLDHNLIGDGSMHALASRLAAPTDVGLRRLGLDELYVECNAARDESTRAVQDYFMPGDETPVKGEASARQVCEAASVSIYRCLGGAKDPTS